MTLIFWPGPWYSSSSTCYIAELSSWAFFEIKMLRWHWYSGQVHDLRPAQPVISVLHTWKQQHKEQGIGEWIGSGMLSFSYTSNRVHNWKRQLQALEQGHAFFPDHPLKRNRHQFDHDHAETCIEKDYWGENPLFTDLQFQRIFSCSRHVAKRLVQTAVQNRPDEFYQQLTVETSRFTHMSRFWTLWRLCILESLLMHLTIIFNFQKTKHAIPFVLFPI
jgi:hypothetical protein